MESVSGEQKVSESSRRWARVEADAAVRVVILTSADCGVFSAGLDLKQAAEIRARDGVDILTLMRDPMQSAMRNVTKPIIAAMTGSLMADEAAITQVEGPTDV